jgi:membrane associated rhomboid family serine protease
MIDLFSVHIAILIITIIVSNKAFKDRILYGKLMFNAYQIQHRNEWYRFFSHGLVHGDVMHLGVNMFVLYMFGGYVEDVFKQHFENKGIFFFILMYVTALVVSTSASFLKHKNNPAYNAVGASGAVSAIVFSFILFNPDTLLYLFFVLPIPGWLFGLLYLVYSHYMGKKGADNIGHEAHFWGALYGFVFPLILEPELFQRFLEKILG